MNLLNKCYDGFSSFKLKFWSSEINTENAIKEESDYFKETVSAWTWTEKSCGNESHEKEAKHFHA